MLLFAALAVLNYNNAYAGCDPVPAGTWFTAETYEAYVNTQCTPDMQEKIRQHDSMEGIPPSEPFESGEAGMTWEEFINLPRRMPTPEETAGMKEAVEHRERVVEHGVTLGDSFGNPTGTNNFVYDDDALNGDILLVHDGTVAWGYFRHVGMYDRDNLQILEADTAYGVHYTTQSKFKGYDVQVGLKPIAGYGYMATNALLTARTHIGKAYSYDWGNKYRTDKFYCSSLVWRSYLSGGWDLDSDGSDFVSPDDIYYDRLLPNPHLSLWQWAN